MPKENMTRYAILGLLASGCTSGYEMKHTIDTSLNHFWKISFGQVYPMLKTLAQEGLIVEETGDGDDRKMFVLTSDGEAELGRWVQEPTTELPVQRNELLLKLYFARHESKDTTIQKINQHAALLRERLDMYQMIEQSIRSYPGTDEAVYWLLTLDYGKRKTQALLEWCAASIQTLEGGKDDETRDRNTK
ncbi:PadR family transcriptional regulator [Exiguobacterium antarcticum]|uniref:PadR family transcriptional regulator n=1 Tax=Exiguobacterium antarcticum TaxID=132920 RepID=A0ABT6R4C2_9BACL|nr:PadR family transcriptional regulator [Exiguobacterium antarcticum]MDI3235806.1 PadR family transcriptional regulator [Exiguobacterium antarcticum]